MQRDLIQRPLCLAALSLCSGIVYAAFFTVAPLWTGAVILMGAAAALAGMPRYEVLRARPAAMIALMLLAALMGSLLFSLQQNQWQHQRERVEALRNLGEPQITGRIAAISPHGEDRTRLILDSVILTKWGRSQPLESRLLLVADAGSAESLRLGGRIQTKGQIAPVQGPRLPVGMNFHWYRYAQNIFAAVYLDENQPIQIRQASDGFSLRAGAYRALSRIEEALQRWQEAGWLSPGESGKVYGLLGAMAYGLRNRVPPAFDQHLQDSGLAHVTSISGLHVSLVLAALGTGLHGLGLRRKQAAWFTLLASILYLALVGLRIPTLRAAMMAWAPLGALFFQRRAHPLNTLGLAALVILVLSPAELFLPSFQLSFAAVLWLLLFPAPKAWRKHLPAWIYYFAQGLLASLVVVVGLAPLTLYYFHQWNLGAVAGNLAAVPLVTLLLPATYLWTGAMLLFPAWLSDGLGWVVLGLSQALIEVIEFTASIEALQWAIPYPGAAAMALIFLALILLSRPLMPWLHIGKLHVRNLHMALLLLALVAWGALSTPVWSRFEAHFLSLGQGDCILLRTPSGHTVLVDGGPPPRTQVEQERTRLEQYLLAHGIGRIDLMILTHPQSDHIGALSEVIESMPVGLIVEGATQARSDAYQAFVNAAEAKGVARRPVRSGDQIAVGGLQAWVLSPTPQRARRLGEVNEASVVTLWRYGEFDLLLTGDIGASTERVLTRRFEDWRIDGLKVAHHGSRYSTSARFLGETRPAFAVIQCGRNPYGHPHPDTRHRLHDIQAHVLRTDDDGTIIMQSDGKILFAYATRSHRLYRLASPL